MGLNEGKLFRELVEIMTRLRGEGGCPWDREQTRESLKPFLLEETYEVLEALDRGDPAALQEELGDLLLQVIFHATVAREKGEFTIAEVLQTVADKLTRRHPHVFGAASATTSEEVLTRWEAIKRAEKQDGTSALDGVPRELPALLRAQRVQEKASRVGCDWPDRSGALAKVDEELAELKEAVSSGEASAVEEEMGDFFFSLVNLCRFLRLNGEEALRKAIGRFTERFHAVEREIRRQGKRWEDVTLPEIDALWERAKTSPDASADAP